LPWRDGLWLTFRLFNGSYPTTEQGLQALREQPVRAPVPANWRGPYLRKAVPNDPWGRPYLYRFPGERNTSAFDLRSLGRDGQSGGTGEDEDIGGNDS
jgi:general secretion pathway protein G